MNASKYNQICFSIINEVLRRENIDDSIKIHYFRKYYLAHSKNYYVNRTNVIIGILTNHDWRRKNLPLFGKIIEILMEDDDIDERKRILRYLLDYPREKDKSYKKYILKLYAYYCV